MKQAFNIDYEDDDPDDRRTLPPTIIVCKQLAGVPEYTMDVAASDEWHLAPLYYTKEQNGLLPDWYGDVWCNPPYSDITPWVEKAWRTMQDDRAWTISMLVPSRTDVLWWQQMVEPFRDGRPVPKWAPCTFDVHFMKRQRFGSRKSPEGKKYLDTKTGKWKFSSPPFGVALLVWKKV